MGSFRDRSGLFRQVFRGLGMSILNKMIGVIRLVEGGEGA